MSCCASVIGDHPVATLVVVGLIVAIVVVVAAYVRVAGLWRRDLDQDKPETRRIRKESLKWWWGPHE